MFKLCSEYEASGDQPKAIKGLLKGLDVKKRDQVLLGVTGSGKTFSMAHIIAKHNKPTLIMIIISPKLIFLKKIFILKKIHQLMSILI